MRQGISQRPLIRLFVCTLSAFAAAGCSETEEATDAPEATAAFSDSPAPFDLRGDLEGLMLVYYDAEGAHTATTRSEVPEGAREHVLVDDLNIAPEEREAGVVYVADLRAPDDQGSYPSRQYRRAAFDELIAELTGAAQREQERLAAAAEAAVVAAQAEAAGITLYGASWCSACRQAAHYFEAEGIPFEEKDIERDPGARQEMVARAQAAGVNPGGIPVITIGSEVLTGFSEGAVAAALARHSQASPRNL